MSVQVTSPTPNIPTNTKDQFFNEVERDLLLQVIQNMKHRQITIAQAHQLAQDFLTLLPMSDKEDLLHKLNNLGHKYIPARAVYVKYGGAAEEEKRQKLLEAMREHIQQGNIEQAIAVAKGGGI